MPRKKITEPKGLDQTTNLDQTALTEGTADIAADEDENSSLDALPAEVFAEPEADTTQEGEMPPSAGEGEVVDVELPPPDTQELPVADDAPTEPPADPGGTETSEASPPAPERSDRQVFYDLNFNELDRGLTAEERQEWNSIYASYRGRSTLSGKIIGVDPLSISTRNRQTGTVERQTMYCAVVVSYRVRIVIPASEMWESGDFILIAILYSFPLDFSTV